MGPKDEEVEDLAQWIGADVISDLFGRPDERPGPLLWMANMACHSLHYLKNLFVSESTPANDKNSPKIN
jgi:hypothetical protein